ncbi:MAG: radical SAM protein [Thermoflexales bacterium]|nr:radical SAM protein [Thermoflexales bacterium]
MIHTLSSPAIFSIELTAECNGRCPGCCNVFYHREQRPALPANAWQAIFQAIAPYAHRVRLTGGEPTLHPQFAEIIAQVVASGFDFTVFTNALWPDPDRVVRLLAQAPRCSGLLVSLHGAEAAAHEAFSGVPGSFETVKENIARAVAAGLTVATSTVLTCDNYGQVKDIAALSHELGADHAVFSRYLGRELPFLEPSSQELCQAVREVDLLRKQGQRAKTWRVKFGDCIPQCFVPSSSTGCLAGVAYCTIDPWGHVRPCNHSDLDCGDLRQISLLDAWNSPAMQRWRQMVPPACESDCAAFSQCHGGCRATALARGLAQDPLMSAPLAVDELPPLELVELYEGLRPVGRYEMREERFGYVLLGANLALVTHQAKPLLDMCDGETTLREIETLYGQEGLALVSELYHKGLIEW